MSGGVDSSVAAALLVEQGYDVMGLFMRIGVESPTDGDAMSAGGDAGRYKGCCSATDAADARFVAGQLNIPLYTLDFKDDFEKLIEYFADEYSRGRTPNPCVVCNDRLKFGRLLEYAGAVGADYVATGHYARIGERHGRLVLMKANDTRKEQSYVLFGIDRNVLDRVMFPLGEMTKDQVRTEALRRGLPVHDKPESMEICFVPDQDYARVVRRRRPESFTPGDVGDADDDRVSGLDVFKGRPNRLLHLFLAVAEPSGRKNLEGEARLVGTPHAFPHPGRILF